LVYGVFIKQQLQVKENQEMVIKKNEETILSCEISDNDNCSSTDPSQENEGSGKKKTPMCLVNELARHHKVCFF
jgi:hypothetical protein